MENCGRFFFDEAVTKNFWPGSADSAAGTSCGRLNGFCGNAASAAVSIASRSREFGGKFRTLFFLTRPPPRISGPDQPTPRQGLLAAALTAFAATLPAPPFPLPPGPENLVGKLRTLNFFLTRPPPRISGPDQPTPRQELPAAALTAFAATPPAVRFPLPPGPENLGGKLRTLSFFFDEAAAKNFWPGSAGSAAGTSCGRLNGFCGNAASGAVSIASRSREFGGKIADAFFFDEAVAMNFWPGSAGSAEGNSCGRLNGFCGNAASGAVCIASGPENLVGKLRALFF